LSSRALYPDRPLPPIPEPVRRILAPPDELKNLAKPILSKICGGFHLKPNPNLASKRKFDETKEKETAEAEAGYGRFLIFENFLKNFNEFQKNLVEK
jgi:hypothetical protein